VGRWFKEPFCSVADYKSWREAARMLYEGGILRLYSQVWSIDEKANNFTASNFVFPLVDRYREGWEALPNSGAVFDVEENAEAIAQAVTLMNEGENVLELLRVQLEKGGHEPVPLGLPLRPATVATKSAWTRYAPVGAGIIGTGSLIGLIIAAVRK
jgi:hypothetical protein